MRITVSGLDMLFRSLLDSEGSHKLEKTCGKARKIHLFAYWTRLLANFNCLIVRVH